MTATPQQPGLRSFIVYDRVPAGHAAYPITDDRNAPHLHMGDFAIIDPSDTDPCEGELFLMEWHSSPGHYSANETFSKPGITGWCIGPVAQPEWVKEAIAAGAPPVRWCDFGYKTEALRERLMGRIVGLFQSTYSEPMEAGQ